MGARLCLSVNFPNTNVTATCQQKSYDDDDGNDDGDDDDMVMVMVIMLLEKYHCAQDVCIVMIMRSLFVVGQIFETGF